MGGVAKQKRILYDSDTMKLSVPVLYDMLRFHMNMDGNLFEFWMKETGWGCIEIRQEYYGRVTI